MWERTGRSEDVDVKFLDLGDWNWFCDTPYIFLYTAYSCFVDGKSLRITVYFPRSRHIFVSFSHIQSHEIASPHMPSTLISRAFHPDPSHGAKNAALCASATLPVPAYALAKSCASNVPRGGMPLAATLSDISAA